VEGILQNQDAAAVLRGHLEVNAADAQTLRFTESVFAGRYPE